MQTYQGGKWQAPVAVPADTTAIAASLDFVYIIAEEGAVLRRPYSHNSVGYMVPSFTDLHFLTSGSSRVYPSRENGKPLIFVNFDQEWETDPMCPRLRCLSVAHGDNRYARPHRRYGVL